MNQPIEELLLDLHLRPFVTLPELIPLGVIFALLLGYASYTDIFRNKYISDVASLGLVFASWAALPLLWADSEKMLYWALGASAFFILLFVIGAIADGDLKIYLAYAALLGPASLLVAFLSWVIIIIYSLPIMIRARRQGGQKKGERLGVAPGGPGIALALPLSLPLMGVPLFAAAALLAGMILMVALCWLLGRTTKDSV